MPLLLKIEDPVPKLTHSSQICKFDTTFTTIDSDHIADRLKQEDLSSLIRFIKEYNDEKLSCFHGFVTSDEETPLSIGIYRNSVSLCKVLIEKGCDVNKEAKFPPFYIRFSPLSRAVSQGSIDLVTLFLQHGCSPTKADEYGRNSVQHAICGGHVQILKLFIDNGCDPNTRIPETMFTLLHEACYRGSIDAVKVLLEAGADPNQFEFNDRYIPAFYTHKVPIHKLLLKYGSDINWRSRSGESILHSAVYLGKTELVEVLLVNGAIINFSQTVITYSRNNIASNIQKKELFKLAFFEEHFNICLILVQHGYQFDIFLQKNQIIWSNILSSGKMEIAKILFRDYFYEKCKQKRQLLQNMDKESIEKLNMDQQSIGYLKSWIHNRFFKVKTLMDISRGTIRNALMLSNPKISIFCKLNQLQCVPPKLIDYLMYK